MKLSTGIQDDSSYRYPVGVVVDRSQGLNQHAGHEERCIDQGETLQQPVGRVVRPARVSPQHEHRDGVAKEADDADRAD